MLLLCHGETDCEESKHQFNCKRRCKPQLHHTAGLLVIFEHDDVFNQIKEMVLTPVQIGTTVNQCFGHGLIVVASPLLNMLMVSLKIGIGFVGRETAFANLQTTVEFRL
jgi:hypothetical protein